MTSVSRGGQERASHPRHALSSSAAPLQCHTCNVQHSGAQMLHMASLRGSVAVPGIVRDTCWSGRECSLTTDRVRPRTQSA